MTDADAESDADADAALIDRLYAGEGDEGLRMVRGLVARVRDEMPGVDPPQAISARLLQAAARPAKAPAREGAWSRLRTWFAGIAMHPGLAAAATLVIVAGAAAIWMRQGGKAATPTVSSTAPTGLEDHGAPDHTEPLLPREEKLEGQATAASSFEDELAAAGQDKGKDVRTADKPPPRKTTPPKVVETERAPVGGEGEAAGAGSGRGSATPGDVTVKKVPVVTTKVGGTKPTEDRPSPDPTTSPPPPPAPDSTGTPSTDDEEHDGAPSNAAMARQLTRQATTAAKKGDCATVDYLAKKVKGLDAGYYTSDFVPQPDIAACRTGKK